MRGWTPIADERRVLYSPVALHLIDDLTGAAPEGILRAELDEQDGGGAWYLTTRRAVRSPGDVLLYPGLGRSSNAAAHPVRRYRVRLISDLYLPEYLAADEGIEFDAHPYDDLNPPAVVPQQPDDTFLLPSTAYPFPSHVRVLRGLAVDFAGLPIPFAEISEGARERVLTDTRGAFALPLRWPALFDVIPILAVDNRTGRNGQINVALPGDLSQGITIILL